MVYSVRKVYNFAQKPSRGEGEGACRLGLKPKLFPGLASRVENIDYH